MRYVAVISLCMLGVTMLAVSTAMVAAQQPAAPKTPEEVVTRYFERIKADGIDTVANMMHPDELKKFKEMLAPVIQDSFEAGDHTFDLFADAHDASKMGALDDVAFMDTFMTWVTRAVPNLTAAMKGASMQAIGHVVEGDVKHIVVRSKMKVEDMEVEKMSVISVKDHEGTPMMLLTGEIKGVAQQLKRRR